MEKEKEKEEEEEEEQAQPQSYLEEDIELEVQRRLAQKAAEEEAKAASTILVKVRVSGKDELKFRLEKVFSSSPSSSRHSLSIFFHPDSPSTSPSPFPSKRVLLSHPVDRSPQEDLPSRGRQVPGSPRESQGSLPSSSFLFPLSYPPKIALDGERVGHGDTLEELDAEDGDQLDAYL